jgi:hypothetical protein
MAVVFLGFSWRTYKSTETENLAFHIERFWYCVPLPLIFLLVAGGYLVARPHPGAR